jgi:hypothetical protein
VTTRSAVLAAAAIDLAAITSIGYTGTVLKGYAELTDQDFPAAMPIDGSTTIRRLAYANRLEATMNVDVWCFVQSVENDFVTARLTLIADVIKALSSGTLAALADDVLEIRIETDQIPNIGIARVTFEVTYTYDSTAP